MARNRQWRMSSSEWSRVLADCLERPDRSHLVRAAVSFDFRQVAGGLDIVRPLVAIERQAPRHPDFVARLARTATDFTPPLGRRGKLITDDDGPHRPQEAGHHPDRATWPGSMRSRPASPSPRRSSG